MTTTVNEDSNYKTKVTPDEFIFVEFSLLFLAAELDE